MSTCLLRGRSTPAILAIFYPCLCLCFEFSQITRTTPLRCTILHLSQIFLTDARTFMVCLLESPRVTAGNFKFEISNSKFAEAAFCSASIIYICTQSCRASGHTVRVPPQPCRREECG